MDKISVAVVSSIVCCMRSLPFVWYNSLESDVNYMSFSKEQRAHDLATSLLPDVIKESKWAYYEYDDNGTGHFNPEIIEEYNLMYDYFLKEFEYYDEAKS